MKLSTLTIGLGLSLSLALACGDDDHEELTDLQKCCYIGRICHEGSEANEEFAECHELGHDNVGPTCRADFERCKTLCDPDNETTLPEDCEDPSGDPH